MAITVQSVAFSALTLLAGWQEGHPVCRNWVVRYWHGSSDMQMICIRSSWCHCHPIIYCFIKTQNSLRFWCRLTQVVLEKKGVKTDVVVLVYSTICVSRHPQLRIGGFCWSKVLLPTCPYWWQPAHLD